MVRIGQTVAVFGDHYTGTGTVKTIVTHCGALPKSLKDYLEGRASPVVRVKCADGTTRIFTGSEEERMLRDPNSLSDCEKRRCGLLPPLVTTPPASVGCQTVRYNGRTYTAPPGCSLEVTDGAVVVNGVRINVS